MSASKGPRRRSRGRFADRIELTCHVWAMRRQQVFPNLKLIAAACGVTTEVVKTIIESEEGLEYYLNTGCLSGAG